MLKILCKFCLLIGFGIGALMPFPAGIGPGAPEWAGAAMAEDMDDDAGGDDDDDRTIRRPAPRIRPAPVRRAAPATLPTRAPDEIVAPRLAEADFQTLLDQGYRLIDAYRRADASISRRLRIPAGTTVEAARDLVRALDSGETADFNHFYRTEEAEALSGPAAAEGAANVIAAAAPARPDCTGNHCADWRLIDWPSDAGHVRGCLGDVTIGLIDTGLNEAHEALDQARLNVIRLTPARMTPSDAVHGTAVAGLLLGDPASRSPGLVPGARVIAVDAFHQDKGDQRADVFSLIKGLTELADQGADVINLSLAGPANSALRDVILELSGQRNIIIVAAAGNAGARSGPRFPAAYDPVIAVTAVDRDRRIYRRAVNGPHVDFAAPGVDVWTAASVTGARSRTGTSFAAPFVTAAIALMRGQNPDLSADGARQMLARDARDLGAPGRDPVFGHGLISAAQICPG